MIKVGERRIKNDDKRQEREEVKMMIKDGQKRGKNDGKRGREKRLK